LFGRGQRTVVAAKTVAEDRARPVGDADPGTLAPHRRFLLGGAGQRGRLGLTATERGEAQGSIGREPDAGRFRNSLGDIAGAENLAGLLGSFIGALPDLYAAEQDITAENDLVMVRLVVTATVKGSLLGVPADSKPVRWNAIDIYRITDGKISEEWAADDIATIMTQVGVFTPPWAA
jgi:SnoaL-like polyketide cyclase